MLAAMTIFWLSVFYLAYHLVFYGEILYVLNLFVRPARRLEPQDADLPGVSVICPAFNEERDIRAKIESFLALDYPPEKLEMLVISDDSTDGTNAIVESYAGQRVRLIVQKPRRGKQAAHNLARQYMSYDYVLSTDATAIFEPQCVRRLMTEMLSDPRVALVSGRLKLVSSGGKQSGEGLYIRYESFLRDLDSRFHSVLVATGALYLIKRDFFGEIDEASADDFERTLQVLDRGYRAKFAADAAVVEEETEHAREEMGRKIRIISQEWQCVARVPGVINLFKHPCTAWMMISHKLLRWLFFVPVALIWVMSLLLVRQPFYAVVFVLSSLGLGMGTLELWLQSRDRHIPGMGLAAYFVAMLAASTVAFANFLKGKSYGVWESGNRSD